MSKDTSTPTLFETCKPRTDVVAGDIPEDQFAASVNSVVHTTTAPDVYANPRKFFEKTYPTNGIQDLLTHLTERFTHAHKNEYSGTNGVLRVDTSFGGGKTHTEIAAYHLASQPKKINNLHKYFDPEPGSKYETGKELENDYLNQLATGLQVNTAVVVGAEIDARNARCDLTDSNAPSTNTLWGEMAYQLFGESGYEFIREYDEERVAPGANILGQLFNMHDNPSLVMLDEIAAYLAQAAGVTQHVSPDKDLEIADDAEVGDSTLATQTNAFLMSLLSATENTDQLTVVVSIADTAFENRAEQVREIIEDFNNISDKFRKDIVPTEDEEIASVLRYRLFEDIKKEDGDTDEDLVSDVVETYSTYYESNRSEFPELENDDDDLSLEDQLENAYPFHPTTIDTLTKELDTLPEFHRTRGALKLLSRAISDIWNETQTITGEHDRHFIRLYDLHPSNTEVRSTLLRLYDATGLDLDAQTRADVYAGDETSHAQIADTVYGTSAPMGTHLTTTILWKSLIETASGRGASKPQVLYANSHAGLEIDEYRNVMEKLVNATDNTACHYLHREGSGTPRYVFKVEAKPIKMVEAIDVDDGIIRSHTIEALEDAAGKGGAFDVIMQPETPHAVPDTPKTYHLAVMDYDTVSVMQQTEKDVDNKAASDSVSESTETPEIVTDIYQHWASSEDGKRQMREYKNTVVFLVADTTDITGAHEEADTIASIERVKQSDDYDLTGETIDKLDEMLSSAKSDLSEEIKQAYKNAYVPGENGLEHEQFTINGTLSESITRYLDGKNRIVKSGDGAYGKRWVEKNIWNAGATAMTTEELVTQFGKRPGVDFLLSPVPLRKTISKIVSNNTYAYWDSETEHGYYNGEVTLTDSERSLSDAENLTSDVRTSDVSVSDTQIVFDSIDALVNSDKTTITWKEYACEDCGNEYPTEQEAEDCDCTVVECDDCGEEVEDIEAHDCDEPDDEIQCDVCGEEYPSGDDHTCSFNETEMVSVDSPTHIETAINELRKDISTSKQSVKETYSVSDDEFACVFDRIIITVESVDGWKEAWFVANNLTGEELFTDTTMDFEYEARTGTETDGTLNIDYTGDVTPFAEHCKFNMEPGELTGSDGERMVTGEFTIQSPSDETGNTPAVGVVLDALAETLSMNNAFTIQLHGVVRFTTAIGGDE